MKYEIWEITSKGTGQMKTASDLDPTIQESPDVSSVPWTQSYLKIWEMESSFQGMNIKKWQGTEIKVSKSFHFLCVLLKNKETESLIFQGVFG